MLRKWVKEFAAEPGQAFPGQSRMKLERLATERLGRQVAGLKHRLATGANGRGHAFAKRWMPPAPDFMLGRALAEPALHGRRGGWHQDRCELQGQLSRPVAGRSDEAGDNSAALVTRLSQGQ
ncbi:hypothetical protein [Bosea sp. (in: a-proteobacteria)]|uniref:hypothetical protein n=1 Tax=Bosea sp. (in: a-proteobacteria) TaxID=1871050 RepID=UPI0035664D10